MEFHVTNVSDEQCRALARSGRGSYIRNVATGGKHIKLKEFGGTFQFEIEADSESEASIGWTQFSVVR